MRGVITSASPLEVTKFGDTVAQPVSERPSGLTLVLNDVVWFEKQDRKVVVVQRLVAP